jgi:hypothetical protein
MSDVPLSQPNAVMVTVKVGHIVTTRNMETIGFCVKRSRSYKQGWDQTAGVQQMLKN